VIGVPSPEWEKGRVTVDAGVSAWLFFHLPLSATANIGKGDIHSRSKCPARPFTLSLSDPREGTLAIDD
jgi:hypothetical protein